ncbi:hypothetical protein GUK30_29380 [Rhizobium leguminosarum]|uniref:hypothetical protein n=1 Tax=Rhizobium TaxID=379 RepID=UPI0013C1E477|nr:MULTISPECIES: hypothetical protein [Rhizobium]NEI23490.1 hypothetical protein [Rhizobium ruizarguesonis]NEK38602.1 hypothetical protein [Rhizobium leguminosarum]
MRARLDAEDFEEERIFGFHSRSFHQKEKVKNVGCLLRKISYRGHPTRGHVESAPMLEQDLSHLLAENAVKFIFESA